MSGKFVNFRLPWSIQQLLSSPLPGSPSLAGHWWRKCWKILRSEAWNRLKGNKSCISTCVCVSVCDWLDIYSSSCGSIFPDKDRLIFMSLAHVAWNYYVLTSLIQITTWFRPLMSWCQEIFTHLFAFQKNSCVFVSQWRCKASVPDGTCGKCSCMCIMVGRSASGQPHWLQHPQVASDERKKVPIWVHKKWFLHHQILTKSHGKSKHHLFLETSWHFGETKKTHFW